MDGFKRAFRESEYFAMAVFCAGAALLLAVLSTCQLKIEIRLKDKAGIEHPLDGEKPTRDVKEE